MNKCQKPSLILLAWFSTALASAADSGTIIGTVDQPATVKSVQAMDRATGKKVTGTIDKSTGRFIIAGLSFDANYDCIIDFERSRLEGVNLKVPRSDYEEEQPMTADDIATIKAKIRGLNQFEDQVDILTVVGNIQHAAILVNKVRTKAFYGAGPGEVVWRAELWHFERPEETWVKVQDELFTVLYRERLQKTEYEKKSITFDAALGGLHPTAKQTRVDLGRVRAPATKPGIRIRELADQKAK